MSFLHQRANKEESLGSVMTYVLRTEMRWCWPPGLRLSWHPLPNKRQLESFPPSVAVQRSPPGPRLTGYLVAGLGEAPGVPMLKSACGLWAPRKEQGFLNSTKTQKHIASQKRLSSETNKIRRNLLYLFHWKIQVLILRKWSEWTFAKMLTDMCDGGFYF